MRKIGDGDEDEDEDEGLLGAPCSALWARISKGY